MTITLTEAERAYLKSQPLARLATVDAGGAPQNSPVGAFLDEETGDIIIGGGAMGTTRKFRNVAANGQVALVVDDLVSRDPWTVQADPPLLKAAHFLKFSRSDKIDIHRLTSPIRGYPGVRSYRRDAAQAGQNWSGMSWSQAVYPPITRSTTVTGR